MQPLHLTAALGIVAIWGFNFVVIKLGLQHLPPLLLCAIRFALAAFPAVLFVKRPDVPLRSIAAYGFVMFGLQFAFLFGGMNLGLSAGLASLTLQLQSFMTIALSSFLLGERPSRFQVAGAVLAFSGIGIVALHVGGGISTAGLLAVVLAALSWAIGNILSKRMGKVDMFALVVWGSLVVPLPMLALSFLLEGTDRIAESLGFIRWSTLAAIVYLVYPTTLLVPVFGMASSVAVLGEALQPWKILAFGVVILGLCVNLFGARLLVGLRGVRQ